MNEIDSKKYEEIQKFMKDNLFTDDYIKRLIFLQGVLLGLKK
jgi:hypothetical protein